MPVTFDAVGVGATTSGNSMSWSHTCSGDNRVLLVATDIFRSGSGGSAPSGVRTCKYAGVDMVSLGVQQYLDGTGWIEVWGLVNPAAGTNQVTWTHDQAPTLKDWDGGSVSYTGAGSFGSVAIDRGSSASPSVTVACQSSMSRAVGFFQSRANFSAPTQTQRYLDNTSPRLLIQDVVGAASVTLAATVSANSWAAVAVDVVTSSVPTVADDVVSVVDAGGVAANRPDADAGGSGDAGGVAAQLPSSESGVFAETQRIAVASSDSGVAVEGNAVNVPKPSTDTVVGSETDVVTAKTVATDTAVGADIAAVSAKNPAADTGGHADAGKVLAFIQSGDTSVWLEAAGAITAASSSDSAHAVEGGGVVLPGYSSTAKRTWTIPASVRVTVIDREDRVWRVPRGEHSYKPAPGTAPYTLPFTLTA